MKRRKSTLNCWALFVVLLLTSGALDYSLTPTGVAEGYMMTSSGGVPSLDAVAHASGEFRIVAANLLWIKVVDHYHHQFMAKGGAWNRNTSLMPYLRMIVWLDPHFIEAYEVGGSILAGTHRYKECDEYLDSGTRNNIDNWQLYYDRAMLRAWYEKEPDAALPFAEHALQCAPDAFVHQRVLRFCRTLQAASALNKTNQKGESTLRSRSMTTSARRQQA